MRCFCGGSECGGGGIGRERHGVRPAGLWGFGGTRVSRAVVDVVVKHPAGVFTVRAVRVVVTGCGDYGFSISSSQWIYDTETRKYMY